MVRGIMVDNGADIPMGPGSDPVATCSWPWPARIRSRLAFGVQPPECAPEVIGVSAGASPKRKVELHGTVNPCHAASTYVLELTPAWRYEEAGFAGALVAGQGSLGSGGAPVEIDGAADGLEAGTAYRFGSWPRTRSAPPKGKGLRDLSVEPGHHGLPELAGANGGLGRAPGLPGV